MSQVVTAFSSTALGSSSSSIPPSPETMRKHPCEERPGQIGIFGVMFELMSEGGEAIK